MNADRRVYGPRPDGASRRTVARGTASQLLAIAASVAVVVGVVVATSQARATALAAPSYAGKIGTCCVATMYPSGVAVDSSGNVYVADTGNYSIEKYAAGTTNLLWSVGVRGDPIGGGTDSFVAPRDVATDGTYVYVADTDDALVQVLNASDGSFVRSVKTFGTGGTGKFSDPIGISVGHDGATEEILVSDGVSGNVYVFNTSFTLLLTVPPTAKNEGTRDAATDSSGDIYTADYRGNKVDKYSAAGALLTSWGTTSGCQDVAKPYGIDVDANNHVYVASSNLEQIKVFDTNGGCLNVGSSTSNAIGTKSTTSNSSTGLFQLRRVAVGSGSTPLVYAADLWGLKILTYRSTDGSIATSSQPELGNGQYPVAGALNEPRGIAIDPATNQIFTADMVNQRIDRFDLPGGTSPIDWGTKGVQETSASFNWPQGIAYDPVSGNVWVANTRNNAIDEFSPSGAGPLRTLPTTSRTTSIFNWPMSVTFDPSGNMYVANTFSSDIEAFSVPTTGAPTLLWKVGTHGTGNGQFIHPWGVAYDSTAGRLLVLDTNNNRVVALNPSTGAYMSTVVSGKGSGPGQLSGPLGITVDAGGNLWVADTGNNRVEEFASSGTFLQTFGTSGMANGEFNSPQGLAFDASGQLYVADSNNNRIQIFSVGGAPPTPTPTPTVTPTPSPTPSPGAPTYTSQISNPGGVAPLTPNDTALANDGTLYASDNEGLRIVKVDPGTGAITTVSPASNGWSHPSGLFLESDQTHMLVADKDNNRIVEIDVATGAFTRVWGGKPGAVDAGEFNAPESMIMDSGGTIYVNDTYHYRVVALAASTGAILWTQSTATGSGTGCNGSALMRNRGITMGSDGDLYVADTDESRIVKLNPATGSCMAVFGGKGTTLGVLQEPRGIWTDGGSGLWVADNGNSIIQHLTLSGTSLWKSPTTFGSGSCPSNCQLRSPHGLEVVGGTIYVSDTYNYRIAIYTANTDGSASFSSYVTEPYPATGGFDGPFGVAYNSAGDLYVVDHYNNRVEEFQPNGSYLGEVGGAGTMLGSFNYPRGIVVIPSTSSKWANDVMICDSENHRMQVFTQSSFNPGGYGTPEVGHLVPVGTTFLRPQQISISPVDGSLWVADTNHGRVMDVDLSGNVLHVWNASGNTRPTGVVVDSSGNVYVTGSNLSEYSATGTLKKVVGPQGGAAGDVRAPDGMAISGSTLYVADTNNNRVNEYNLSSNGAFVLSFGTFGSGDGQFKSPYMVAVGPTGQIAVTDFGNNRISLWQS